MIDEFTSSAGGSLEVEHRPGTFKKGYDPRRNLKGTPREAITARKFIRRIAAELIKLPDSEIEVTRAYAMLRLMFSSKAPKDKETLMKALWPGLLKDELDLTSGGEKLKGYVTISPDDWDKSKDDGKT